MKRGFTLIPAEKTGKVKTRKAFTLIEALTVIAIIGTLATITTYVVTSAQRQARDAKRRSDLTAIGVSFQARFESQTCSSSTDKGRYPGYGDTDNNAEWQPISGLSTYVDSCGAFTEFLSSVPTDPRFNSSNPYQFNLSRESGSVYGRHFRLRARLERTLTTAQRDELNRLSRTWVGVFGGRPYGSTYSYFLGD